MKEETKGGIGFAVGLLGIIVGAVVGIELAHRWQLSKLDTESFAFVCSGATWYAFMRLWAWASDRP